jgi:glucose uptake protein GlcU
LRKKFGNIHRFAVEKKEYFWENTEKRMKQIQNFLLLGPLRAFFVNAFVVACIILLFPQNAQADLIQTELGAVQNFSEFISNAWKWGSNIIFGMATVAIIVGGILIVASGGSEERADMGRQTVQGGIIGIIITLFSAVFNRFLQDPVRGDEQKKLGDLLSSLDSVATGLVALIGGISAAGIIYSAIKYMTSGGDEEKIASAKKALKMSIWGTIIAGSAWGISHFLFSMS